MVTISSIGSGKKVNVGQNFANGMSALQTVEKEKFVIIDDDGTKKDAERLSLFKLKDIEKTYIVYFNTLIFFLQQNMHNQKHNFLLNTYLSFQNCLFLYTFYCFFHKNL